MYCLKLIINLLKNPIDYIKKKENNWKHNA